MATSDDLDLAVIKMAVDAMPTDTFEQFGQAMMEDEYGIEFEPTGGMHDGGQDGFLRNEKGAPDRYVQISKEKDASQKIRGTLRRLSDSDRKCSSLRYITNIELPTKDVIEANIESKFGCSVKIIDKRTITQHIISSNNIRSIFRSLASSHINEILKISRTEIRSYNNPDRMSIVTYLEIHSEDQPHEHNFLLIAADAAIYHALEGTDPDTKKFKTKEEILKQVYERCPALEKSNLVNVEERLERLSMKKSSPRIRKYKEERYCLPYEIRGELNEKNLLISTMESDFLRSLEGRAKRLVDEDDEELRSEVVRISFIAINEAFKANSANLSRFLNEEDSISDDIRTFDFVEAALRDNSDVKSRNFTKLACEKLIREVFYSSSDDEIAYLKALFKLYSVEFILSGDERVARHFQNVLNNMRLIVGTDILVRAFSEYCMFDKSQSTVNMLSLLNRCGVQLLVTDSILDELYRHIRATKVEFEGDYLSWEHHATVEHTKNCDRILIRAYFYAKLEPDRHEISPQTWGAYLGRIASAAWFDDDSKSGREDFSQLVLRRYNLEKISKHSINEIVNEARVGELGKKLAEEGKPDWWAENDAVIVSYVNNYRDRHDESNHRSLHGFSTWWLTEEHKVVTLAKRIGMRYNFVMHPHTLMSYVIANPRLQDVVRETGDSFPVNFGLRITERVHEEGFHRFRDTMKSMGELDEDVQDIRIQSATNKLLGQMYD